MREATTVAGHAVRQLYLDCGAVDVAIEIGDTELLDGRPPALAGHGRHAHVPDRWPRQPPPRRGVRRPVRAAAGRAYAETCAAIASVMLAWRLLLATGDPACADVIERTMYNGVLPGVSLDGDAFFYVNPLQRRTARAADEPRLGERQPWYPCACCPPNVMRMLSSWPQYLATDGRDGRPGPPVRHRRASGPTVAGGPVRLGDRDGLSVGRPGRA